MTPDHSHRTSVVPRVASALDPYVDLAETTRSGIVESVHRGAVVVLGPDGAVACAAGDPSVGVYPRSATKPLQALAMVQCGLALPSRLLVLVAASHSGTPIHLDGVREILASAGLDESALQNTPDLPLDVDASQDVIRSGGVRSALAQNCSGKHAGMLATCVINGWPTATYLQADHPLQRAITATVLATTGCPVDHVGIDGCGAPAHVTSLLGLATAFRSLVVGAAGDGGLAVTGAMSTHPDLLGGPGRDVTDLIRSVPGLVAKDGAEGVYAAALDDGRAVAFKIADGASRARPPVMLAVLRSLGIDVSTAELLLHQAILGHSSEVGQVRITDSFAAVLGV